MTTWYCPWQADDFYPSEGVVRVEAETAMQAISMADVEMQLAASMNEGPQVWRWLYAPTTERPWPAWRDK